MQLVDLPYADPVTMYVLFTPSSSERMPTSPWWFRFWRKHFMKPGYGHCLVVFKDPQAVCWLIIDPLYGSLYPRAIPGSYSLDDVIALYSVTEVVPVYGWRGFTPEPHFRGLLTCVSVVKAVLGVGGRSFTPWQLRQQLAAMEIAA